MNKIISTDEQIQPIDYLETIKAFYIKKIQPYKGHPVGCSLEKINALENKIGFPLPEAYKQFLLWMGNDHNGIFVGTDIFFKHIIDDPLDNDRFLPGLLSENNIEFELPQKYLVFFSHQGYMAAWYALPKESENPTVYFYGEGQNLTAPREEGTFTDFISEELRGLAGCLHYSLQHIGK